MFPAPSFWEWWGLIRSLLIYHAIPFRARVLRTFYRRFVRPGDLCFDVGAHVGNHLRAFVSLGARVVAVEPHSGLISLLRRWYGDHPQVTLREEALGAQVGGGVLRVSARTPTLSSLSKGWIRAVRGSHGFDGVRWDEEVSVQTNTLDALIAAYGSPTFCKIDVEGYELEVLKGLSQAIPALSFEYLPPTREIALGCTERLGSLGDYEYNLTRGESRELLFSGWLQEEDVRAYLDSLPSNSRSGDVIARLRR